MYCNIILTAVVLLLMETQINLIPFASLFNHLSDHYEGYCLRHPTICF